MAGCGSLTGGETWLRGYKKFFVLNSAEHEIFPANKSQITNNCKFFHILYLIEEKVSCSAELSMTKSFIALGARSIHRDITKTCLFKYIENFTSKN